MPTRHRNITVSIIKFPFLLSQISFFPRLWFTNKKIWKHIPPVPLAPRLLKSTVCLFYLDNLNMWILKTKLLFINVWSQTTWLIFFQYKFLLSNFHRAFSTGQTLDCLPLLNIPVSSQLIIMSVLDIKKFHWPWIPLYDPPVLIPLWSSFFRKQSISTAFPIIVVSD